MSVVLPINEDARFRLLTASAGQTLLAITFPWQDDNDLALFKKVNGDWVELGRPQDFTLSGAGAAGGGSATITTPAAVNGEEYLVLGAAVLDRLSSVVRDGRFSSKNIDDELDRNRIIQQEQARDLKRAYLAPIGSTGGEILASEPGQFLIRDQDGNIVGSDPPNGAGNMNTGIYDPAGIAGDVFDRRNWGDFDSQGAFAAKNIPAAVMRVSVGTGLGRHDKLRIAAPGTVRPWHSQSADGAWWEIVGPVVRMEMIASLGTAAANQVTLDGAIKYASEKKVPLEILGDISIDGQVDTRSGLLMDFKQGSVLRQTKRSVTGSFITNVTALEADRIQTDIFIRNPQIDGSLYPDPVILVVESATTTTITFTSASGASAVDDAYTGMMFQCMEGALASGSGTGTISDYVGSTRTATLSSALPSAPVAGVDVQIGFNDNAIACAWGTKRGTIEKGYLRNFPHSKMTPPILGAKGINLEQGNDQWDIEGVTIENCGTAIYLSGMSGTMSNGASRRVVGARVSNIHAEKCGSFLTAANLDGAAGISAATNEVKAVVENSTYHNCGHAGLRIVGTAQEKCGVINLMGANGITIANIRGDNDADVVTQLGGYPTDYSARAGFGLSGPPGALIWGHCRNSALHDISHGGDLDAVVHIGRVRALGDDATPGQVTQLIGWEMRGINVFGTVARVVSRDENLGFVSSEIQGYWEIIVDTVSDVFVPPQFTAAAGLILDITRRSDRTRIIGSAKDLITRGNTFASYVAGEEIDLRKRDRRRITLADDAFVKLTPLRDKGTIRIVSAPGVVGSGSSLNDGAVTYGIADGSVCVKDYGANLSTGTTALTTGTADGVDGNWNIHAVVSDGVYVKNRTGASRTVDLILE